MTFIVLGTGHQPRRAHARAVCVAAALACLPVAGPAFAQGAGCTDIQKMLLERKAIGDRIGAAAKGKKQIDARIACTNFGQLVSNGQSLVKWIETNKDWCQIPDSFADGIKADHGRAVSIRGRACTVAATQAKMEKQAREGGASGAGGLLGGGGLSGLSKMPQGAL